MRAPRPPRRSVLTAAKFRLGIACSALQLALVASEPALAQTSGPQAAIAEALFQEGRKLLEAGRVAEACAKLGESYRIDPAVGTLLNLAVCHEREGRIASAWAEFADAAAMAERSGQAERAQFARAERERLQARVPRLVLTVTARVPGLVLKVDGSAIGEGAWATPIPLDPGIHAVEATAPHRKPWQASLTLKESEPPRVLPIPELEHVAPAALRRGTSTRRDAAHANQASTPPTPIPAEPGQSRRSWGYIAAAVGVAGFGTGTYWGLRTLAKQSVVDAHCSRGVCRNETGMAADAAAHQAATWANISFGVGLAGAVISTYLLLLAEDGAPDKRGPRGPSRSGQVRLLPTFGPRKGALDACIEF